MIQNSKILTLTGLALYCMAGALTAGVSSADAAPSIDGDLNSNVTQLEIQLLTSDQIEISWDSQPGQWYKIETTSELSDIPQSDWTPVGVYPIQATGPTSSLKITSTERKRFFRVRIAPKPEHPLFVVDPGMVFIPAGSFLMGSPENEPGRRSNETQHEVQLTRPFLFAQNEMSLKDGLKILNWAAANDRLKVSDSQVLLNSDESEILMHLPLSGLQWDESTRQFSRNQSEVNSNTISPAFFPSERMNVTTFHYLNGRTADWDASINWTWYGSMAVAAWKNEMEGLPQAVHLDDWTIDFESTGYRLPTEAEWEYACRAGTTTTFHTGVDLIPGPLPQLTTSANARFWIQDRETASLIPPNDWGIFSTHDGPFEWVWDGYGDFNSTSLIDPKGTDNPFLRILRGGYGTIMRTDFSNMPLSEYNLLRSASRFSETPDYTRQQTSVVPYGVRLTKTVPQSDLLSPLQTTPAIIQQAPSSLTLIEGDDWTLSVQYSAESDSRLQWHKNGAPIPGANSSELKLAGLTTNDSGYYGVTITSDFFSVESKPARILVESAPTEGDMVKIPAGYFWSQALRSEDLSQMQPDDLVELEIRSPKLSIIPFPFWIDKTELTCRQVLPIIQWAFDQDELVMDPPFGHSSELIEIHETNSPETVLFNLSLEDCGIQFIDGVFSLRPDMGNYPFNGITDAGATYLCNWRSRIEDLEPAYSIQQNQLQSVLNSATSGYRIPTPFEWEMASRAGTRTAFFNGPEYPSGTTDFEMTLSSVGWHNNNSEGKVQPVAQLEPNAFGLYDTHGNLSEWVEHPEANGRTIRGGSGNLPAVECVASWIEFGSTNVPARWQGVRMVRSAESFPR